MWRRKMIDASVRQKTALEEQNMERHLVKATVQSQYLEEKSTSGASKHTRQGMNLIVSEIDK